jgi:hypothetical protein
VYVCHCVTSVNRPIALASPYAGVADDTDVSGEWGALPRLRAAAWCR